jgi:hypothetical protein
MYQCAHPLRFVLYVAQNEGLEGDRCMAQERLRLHLTWPPASDWRHRLGSESKEAPHLSKPRGLLAKPQAGDRKLHSYRAQKMAGARSRRTEAATNPARRG